jgi:hypothetical protein
MYCQMASSGMTRRRYLVRGSASVGVLGEPLSMTPVLPSNKRVTDFGLILRISATSDVVRNLGNARGSTSGAGSMRDAGSVVVVPVPAMPQVCARHKPSRYCVGFLPELNLTTSRASRIDYRRSDAGGAGPDQGKIKRKRTVRVGSRMADPTYQTVPLDSVRSA